MTQDCRGQWAGRLTVAGHAHDAGRVSSVCILRRLQRLRRLSQIAARPSLLYDNEVYNGDVGFIAKVDVEEGGN